MRRGSLPHGEGIASAIVLPRNDGKSLMKVLKSSGELLFKIVVISLIVIFLSFLGMLMMDVWAARTQDFHFLPIVQQAWGQFIIYLQMLTHGDLGTVTMVGREREVAGIVQSASLNSLGLIGMALSFASILGVVMGVFAALSQHRGQADLTLLLAILGISAPTFLLAVLLQNLGIKYTATFGKRLVSMGGYGWNFAHLAMPVLVLMARPLAYITRATYVSMGEIMSADYIRTARSKGLHERMVFFAHVLRNLGIPLLTALGVSFRFTLGVLPIVEFIFAWPGVGLYALDALQRRQAYLFLGVVLSLGASIQILNALLDWLNHRIDPRLGRA